MGGDIHASLGHDLDRQGMHIARRLRARAEDVGRLADGDPQEAFSWRAGRLVYRNQPLTEVVAVANVQ